MAENIFALQRVEERGLAVLRIMGELEMEKRGEFKTAVDKLLACEESKLVLDLTRVTRLFSMYIGSIADLHKQAENKGKNLSILVNQRLANLFKQTSLDEILNLVVVDR